MLTLSTDSGQAKTQLKDALTEKNTIKMLIFGNGTTEVAIAKKAEIREQAQPARQVIWVQNTKTLSDAETNLFRQGSNDITVCTLNLSGTPVNFLKAKEANSQTALERAFLNAQQN